jgi:hypothetical protein
VTDQGVALYRARDIMIQPEIGMIKAGNSRIQRAGGIA